jgi:pyrroloquinoline quinone biosynthesis protein B
MGAQGPSAAQIRAVLLGCAQDGGVPACGCSCIRCSHARSAKEYKDGRAACLGLVDEAAGQAFLIDATLDFPAQLWDLQQSISTAAPNANDSNSSSSNSSSSKGVALGGILLTHASMGHYTGLLHLGKDVADAKRVPVYCTQALANFLRSNLPWSALVERGNIALTEVTAGTAVQLTENLTVTPVAVPHRSDCGSDAVAYAVGMHGTHKLLYCPATETWEGWDKKDIKAWCNEVDIALLDGTYYRSVYTSQSSCTLSKAAVLSTLC